MRSACFCHLFTKQTLGCAIRFNRARPPTTPSPLSIHGEAYERLQTCEVISEISTALALTAATDGTLAAGTITNGLFGPKWRVKWTSVGTYAGGTTLRIDGYTDGLVLAPSSGG
jgi:hypothetical protein